MITIDGSQGGGQILRSSLSFSSLTGKSVKIINIRSGRINSGLQAQHLTAVNALAQICNAEVTNAQKGAQEIEFIPREITGGNYKFDIGTAGSTVLVLQTLLVPLIHEEKSTRIILLGGTETKWCPSSYDFKNLFLYSLNKMGVETSFNVLRHGFYPKGGGEIRLGVQPVKKLAKLELTKRGKLICVKVIAVASKELKYVAERIINGFREIIFEFESEIKYVDTSSTGCFISTYYEYENCRVGISILGEKGIKAEEVGRVCAKNLNKEIDSGACVDKFTADQLLIYMALAGKGSILTSEITNHIRTNIATIESFIDVKFKINGNLITCSKN